MCFAGVLREIGLLACLAGAAQVLHLLDVTFDAELHTWGLVFERAKSDLQTWVEAKPLRTLHPVWEVLPVMRRRGTVVPEVVNFGGAFSASCLMKVVSA